MSSRRGLQTRTARHRAREIATLRRLRLKRNSTFRGISSPLEVAIEKKATWACWPWNLSTVPTRTPAGKALLQAADLGVVGGEDEDVLGLQRMLDAV